MQASGARDSAEGESIGDAAGGIEISEAAGEGGSREARGDEAGWQAETNAAAQSGPIPSPVSPQFVRTGVFNLVRARVLAHVASASVLALTRRLLGRRR